MQNQSQSTPTPVPVSGGLAQLKTLDGTFHFGYTLLGCSSCARGHLCKDATTKKLARPYPCASSTILKQSDSGWGSCAQKRSALATDPYDDNNRMYMTASRVQQHLTLTNNQRKTNRSQNQSVLFCCDSDKFLGNIIIRRIYRMARFHGPVGWVGMAHNALLSQEHTIPLPFSYLSNLYLRFESFAVGSTPPLAHCWKLSR